LLFYPRLCKMFKKKAFVPGILKKNTSEKVLNHLRKFLVPEEFSLDTCYLHVISLLDFIELIEKNSTQLKSPINLEYLKKKTRPSALLYDYIILEISTYYSKIHSMQLKGSKFPKVPDYWEILLAYRNSGPAHRDRKHEFKTLADHVLNVKKLDSIGTLKIVEDFLEYHKQIKTS